MAATKTCWNVVCITIFKSYVHIVGTILQINNFLDMHGTAAFWNLSDMFPMKNVFEQRDALLQLLFSFALEYAIRRVQVYTAALVITSKESEVNGEKTKYMVMYQD